MKDCFGCEVPESAFIIRHTEVSEFLNCPRAWLFFSHNGLNLEPAIKDHRLRFGTCWHKALECYYDPENQGGAPLDAAIEGFNAALEAEKDRMLQVLGEGFYDPDIQKELQEQVDLAHALLPAYAEWAQEEAQPPDSAFEVVGVERRLLIPIYVDGGMPDAYLAARLDGIVGFSNAWYVLEHKSFSKSINVSDPTNLPLDIQMGLQMLTLQRAIEHLQAPVHGAIYNLARKQKPGPRVRAALFGRHIVRRSHKELEALEGFLIKVVRDMRQAQADGVYRARYNPQMLGKCAWGCSVRPICEAINRGEDVGYLMSTMLIPRQKDIFQTLEEEMNE